MRKTAVSPKLEIEMVKIYLFKLNDGSQLIGELKTRTDGEVVVDHVLNIVGHRPMKKNADGKLIYLTDAEQTSGNVPLDKVRNVPIMSIPDESILSSSNVTEALDKEWCFASGIVTMILLLSRNSLLYRFYATTVDELCNNKTVSDKLFRYHDLENNVARAIYNDELADKYFAKMG
jgi:hypothetical protein